MSILNVESDGGRFWYRDWDLSELHRETGPAIELPCGTRAWIVGGVYHRTDGPALVYPTGESWWYNHGRLHRTGGPAVTQSCGTQCWYRQGTLHRTDGPAVERPNGRDEYWLNGVPMTESQWRAMVSLDLVTS